MNNESTPKNNFDNQMHKIFLKIQIHVNIKQLKNNNIKSLN